MDSSFTLFDLLAQVADCYTPLLLLIALINVVRNWSAGNKLYGVSLLYATFVVYFWMFIDARFQLWSTFGLDYSTHTAAAFALAVLIGINKRRRYQLALAVSLIGYGCLMDILDYHSWSDMAGTLCVVAASLIPVFYIGRRKLFTV
jgi:hypothetical protein